MGLNWTKGTKRVAAGLLALVGCAVLPTVAATGQSIKGNTPKYVANSTVLGPEDKSKVMEVSVWLQPHNRAQMDATARDLYNPTSPNYRKWLKSSDIAAKFAPSAADVQKIQKFLTGSNLKIVQVGPNNFYVRARGTVGDVEAAFHTQLNNYQVKGKTVRANASDPYIEGDAATIVRHVSGLDTAEYNHPYLTRPANMGSSTSGGNLKTAASSTSTDDFFTKNCFTGTKTERFTTGGGYPKAAYSGNNYFASPSAPGCGYTPNEIRTAYNLKPLYAAGYDGSGQTIVIIDWCGAPNILSDANAFSARFGLPKLTSANFQIIETPTPSTCAAPDPEINIDVEWAHVIAPGANIALVVPPSASFQDVNQAVFYAVNYGLGNSLSGSYGSEEQYTSTTELDTENLINEIAAISGISTNFSSGDDGDFTFGFDTPSVSAPADSPWATAVGGVTLALKSDSTIAWQTGWGNNETLLTEEAYIFDPPIAFGFYGGAGGGPSGYFAKPSYQSALPGSFRQLPDISWLADPFTGGVIAISYPGQSPTLIYTVYGGTSLAAPMFSGLWAIANQVAGQPLGLASPYLYAMPSGAITDVLAPAVSKTNVSGTIFETPSTSTHFYSSELVAPVTNQPFYSAFWDYPFDAYTTLVLSFGTDSGLVVGPGWDNVTGLGTPNGQAFINAFVPTP